MAAQGNTKIIYAALFANSAIALMKFAAAGLTGWSAMFAEGVHSVVDTGNQGLLLFGIRRAKRPASPAHPFGHGKDLYFYAFMVAIVIFGAGAGFAAYEGVVKLAEPGAVEVSWVNYVVLAAAFMFESVAWWMAFSSIQKVRGRRGMLQEVRRSKDPTLFTVLFEDSAAMLGLVIAFAGILAANITGNAIYDAAATLAIAVVLALTAVFLAIETKGLLVGEAADPAMVAGLRRVVEADPAVGRVNELLTMHLGPNEILLTLSAEFVAEQSASEVQSAVSRIESQIVREFPDVRRVFIEAQSLAGHRAAAVHQPTGSG